MILNILINIFKGAYLDYITKKEAFNRPILKIKNINIPFGVLVKIVVNNFYSTNIRNN